MCKITRSFVDEHVPKTANMNDETPNSFRIWQKFQRKINFRYNLVFELFQKVGMYSLFEFLRLGNLRMSINFFENEMTIFLRC